MSNETVKIRIDMDEAWVFWPKLRFEHPDDLQLLVSEMNGDQTLIDHVIKSETPSMEISADLIAEYQAAKKAYWDISAKLEQLYRIQEGVAPYPELPIPDYKSLT